MKTARSILVALLATASLLTPVASQAETIFERFAPPLPPLPHIVIRSAPAPIYHEHDEYRRPPARYYRKGYYEHRHHYDRHDHRRAHRREHHEDRHDHRRDWR